MLGTSAKADIDLTKKVGGRKEVIGLLAMLFLVTLLGVEHLALSRLQAAESRAGNQENVLKMNMLAQEIALKALQAKLESPISNKMLLDGLEDSIEDYKALGSDVLGSREVVNHPEAKKLIDRAYKSLPTMEDLSTRLWSNKSTSKDISVIKNWAEKQQPPLLQAAQKLEDKLESQLAGIHLMQSAMSIAATSLVFFIGLIFYKLNVIKLRALLTRTQETKGELSNRIIKLEQFYQELQLLKKANEETEARLAKSMQEIEVANEIMKRANHRFQELFAGMPIACLSTDVEGAIFEWNREAEKLFHLNPGSSYLKNAAELLPDRQFAQLFTDAISRVGKGEMVDSIKWTTGESHGEEVHINARIWPLRTEEGTVTGLVMACFDQSTEVKFMDMVERQLMENREMNISLEIQTNELHRVNQRLEDMATTDGLTGLKNHRTFQSHLRDCFDQWYLNSEKLSVILMDIDHFKSFNDTFGHQAGDEILKMFSNLISTNCPEGCMVARYGGEEFAVVCQGMSETEALELAENLRKCIEENTWPYKPVTTSLGVATCNASTKDPAMLISESDQALYASKGNGRNRATAYSAISEKAA